MKKHLLSAIGIIAACSISATQYMHINLPNGKEYDVKVEKTDCVSHVTEGDEVFIKVTRTDGSSSLYPMDGAEVTFDEEIARMDGNIANWDVVNTMIDGCVLDTTLVHNLRESRADERIIERELYYAKEKYGACIYQKKKSLNTILDESELKAQQSANKYATELFAKITNEENHKDKNSIFSPTSLQFALAMLANGADDDDAYAEITTALGKQNIHLDKLNDLYRKRLTNLMMLNPTEVKIGIANAVFLQNDIRFGKNFLQNLDEYYNATSNNVDFSQDSTYSLMDNWANESTNGMIPSLGISKNSLLRLVIANALSFQSEWDQKFDRSLTDSSKFVTSTGEEKKVETMHNSYRGGYAEETNYQLVRLDFYEGFQMNVILPKEGVSPQSVLAEIDFDNIHYKYGRDTSSNGIDTIYCPSLSLPKFNTGSKIPLNETLNKMGFEKTFSKAFNNIAESAQVGAITQFTHLEIDEDGAKGAAVTIMPLCGSALFEYKHVDVNVNRPFIVTVNNLSTHEVLFIGLINDPTLKE
ncbi:MAG: serpin family protein [Paludibacteraceae bacterium]|nr:serpin family protein [Paludibacteraceae bacterium]